MQGSFIPYDPYHPHLWYTLICSCISWILAFAYGRWKLATMPVQRLHLYGVAMILPLYAEVSGFIIFLLRPAPDTFIGSRLAYFHAYVLQRVPIDSFLSSAAQTLIIIVLISLGLFSLFQLLHSRARIILLMQKAEPLEAIQPELAQIMMGYATTQKHSGAKVFVVVHDAPLAFATGMLHPKVYITTRLLDILSRDERLAVLAHEWAHIMRRDTWWNAGLMIIRNMLAFLPPTLLFWQSIQTSQDEACDRLAVQITQKPLVLAQALVKTAQVWKDYKRKIPYLSSVNAFEMYASSPRQRVESMIRIHQGQETAQRWVVVGAYILIALFLILAPLPVVLGS